MREGADPSALAALSRYLQPRSLRALVLIAFLIVALPLIGAVIYSVLSSTRLTSASERLVSRSIEMTSLSESMSELMLELERNGRQFTITGSPELLNVYQQRKGALLDTLNTLESLTTANASFDALRSDLAQIDLQLEGVSRVGSGSVAPALARAFADARSRVTKIHAQGRTELSRQLAALVDDEHATSRLLLALSIGLAAGAVLLAVGLTALVARPISAIARAVHALGDGSVDAPIAITGPRDLERVGEEIEWLRCELRRLDEARVRLLQHASHELKTPLASIVEASELLGDGTVDGDQPSRHRVTRILQENVARLHRSIDRLLDFAAAGDGGGEPVRRRLLVQNLLNDAVNDHRLPIERRGLQMEFDVVPRDITIRADPQRMRTALENLISNAVKYSPAGGVIELRARRHGGRIRIDVVDEGPGIPPAERNRIFDPFFRVDRGAATAVAGTGIGLSIVQACVRAHGGNVSVVDAVGGAHFRIELPDDDRS